MASDCFPHVMHCYLLIYTKGRVFNFLKHLSNLFYHSLQTVSASSEVPRFNQVPRIPAYWLFWYFHVKFLERTIPLMRYWWEKWSHKWQELENNSQFIFTLWMQSLFLILFWFPFILQVDLTLKQYDYVYQYTYLKLSEGPSPLAEEGIGSGFT